MPGRAEPGGHHGRRRAESVCLSESRLNALTRSDYQGATTAGLGARLVRRTGEWSDGAARKADEDLSNVHTIRSLKEVVEEVRRRNGTI